LKYSVVSKRCSREEKLKHLNIIRERISEFQKHRKKLFVKDQEIPLENQLLKVNQKISFEFDNVLNDAHSIKKTMFNLEKAEQLNQEIEENAIATAKHSGRVLKKLQRFKENNFRPRIHGIDWVNSSSEEASSKFSQDSDWENGESEQEEHGEDEMTEMKEKKRKRKQTESSKSGARSAQGYLKKKESKSEDPKMLAMLKCFHAGVFSEEVVSKLMKECLEENDRSLVPNSKRRNSKRSSNSKGSKNKYQQSETRYDQMRQRSNSLQKHRFQF